MITNTDKQAAEAFVRGEPIPMALEYSLAAEAIERQQSFVRWLYKIGAISTLAANAENELFRMRAELEAIKNQNGGKMPT